MFAQVRTPLDCPLCGGSEREPFTVDNGYAIVRCGACGLLYVPEPPPAEELKSMYDREQWVGASGEVVRRDEDYDEQSHDLEAIEKLAILPVASGRLLDVGCGSGDLVDAAARRGFDAEGVELSAARVERARHRGLTVHHGDLLQLELDGRYDVVTCIDILSHVRAPLPFLARVAELTRAGGTLMIETGNKADLERPEDATYLRDFWGAPGHLTFFGEAQLRDALTRVGFDVEQVVKTRALDAQLSKTRLRGGGKFNLPKKLLLYLPPLRWLIRWYFDRKLGDRTPSCSMICIARRAD